MNTNHELLNNNTVTLSGKVISEPVLSHKVYDEAFNILQLAVPRLSGQVDIIPITISEKLLSEENVKQNDNLTIKGQFRSYNKLEDGK
ncbi:MAG: single-stranded DNA-binding protein, partial [Clostridia bacterium]|nr:single-stranded DNA-binding protein [Clostridia bacterium]